MVEVYYSLKSCCRHNVVSGQCRWCFAVSLERERQILGKKTKRVLARGSHPPIPAEVPAVPDRLARRVVLLVMEILVKHDVLVTTGLDEDWITRDLNKATDAAIALVEKLLRQD